MEQRLNMGTHIILVGFMGAGKTTVGRLLASAMERPFIDVDTLIQSAASRSIADIFAEEGEAGFRTRETEAIARAVAGEPAVIAVGGGALERPDNVRTLRERGELVWLKVPFSEMVDRARAQGGRPLLADAAEAAARYRARQATYGLADVVVDIGGLSPGDATELVRRRLQSRAEEGGAGAAEEDRIVVVDLDERAYEVRIGSGLLARGGQWSEEIGLPDTGLLITNQHVGSLYAMPVLRTLAQAGRKVPRVYIGDGEEHKSFASLRHIYDAALRHRLGRDTAFYALGGGVVGDAAGFAAATYLRGVDYVQMPTTLLAQVDSSVGGKTAVNLPQGKNLVGAFHQPRLVVADVDTLATLPARELAAGWAEVIKYGAIRDGALFQFLEDRQERLAGLDKAALISVVARSCENKAAIVKEDERETGGVRELLNFGHTVGHALEALGQYKRWLHGEAVAIGMVTAALLSRWAGGLSDGDVARLVALLKTYDLPVSPGPVDMDELLAALRRDKKVRRGRLRFVLLRSIGSAYVSDEVTDEWIEEAIREQQTL